jgi:adenylate cyclase
MPRCRGSVERGRRIGRPPHEGTVGAQFIAPGRDKSRPYISTMNLAVKNPRILALSFATIVVILIGSFYLVFTGTMTAIDSELLDLFFRLRGPVDPGKDIVIAALDRESAMKMQRKTAGWRRSDFAIAIQNLTAAGADLIGIDYLFVIPDENPAEDQSLQKALQDASNVVLASDISEKNRAVPFAPVREQEVGEGFINFFPDPDGVLRQIPPLYARRNEKGDFLFDLPFSVQIAAARLYPAGNYHVDLTHRNYMQIGNLQIPYAGRQASDGFLINYAGPPETFPVLPFYQVLRNEFSAKEVSGKIVLIGSMNPYFHDYYRVPFPGKQRGVEKWMQSMYGVEIHANAIHTLVNHHFLSRFPQRFLIATFVAISIMVIVLSLVPKWNPFVSIGTAAVILLVVFGFSYSLFLGRIILPGTPFYMTIVLVTLTGALARHTEEAAERRYITQLFGKYVAPSVVEELVRNHDLLDFAGRKERLTIFFSDIRGFTSMSEKLQPEEVSSLLNEYFSRMTKIVFLHGGTLDKFMGDAIMAFFGNPIYFADHARRAVGMALEMREEMKRLKADWKRQGREYPVDIGMGINTGEVVVGNLGSDDFFDYTVIGDDVNLACRLEAIAKGGQIIMSAATHAEVQNDFEFHKLEPVTVKGKSHPIEIYEVVDFKK